jgi:hypothetical protein
MTASSIIVTGSDSGYFPLMRELIASIRSKPEGAGIALGVLDCGLAAEEAAWCRGQGASLVEPVWDIAFGPGLQAPPPSFRAMTARPWLKRYFPGFETYLWLDADTWVQDWRAVRLFLEAAAIGDIAIVPEVHRSYRNLRDGRDDFEQANGRAYAEAFGEAAARRLIRLPLNNAGAFAIRSTSPAWELWASVLADAAKRSTNMIDQIALNAAIHELGLEEARLPPACNWIAHLATPAWHPERGVFVEPDPPYETIGILHLTLGTKWQSALDVAEAGRVTRRQLSLRYRGNG